jgi:cytochrome bd ubiquinol oxidase subunit I
VSAVFARAQMGLSLGFHIVFAAIGIAVPVLMVAAEILWRRTGDPGLHEARRSIVGVPFSLEGFAFFTEAIFLGVYLYGWNRVRPWAHIAAGVVVAVSGLASAVFVTLVNGVLRKVA